MKIKSFSNDTFEVLQNAGVQAQNYFHTFVGSNHIFLSLFSFLSKNKMTERYKDVYEQLKNVLNKFGVDGQKFQKAFLTYCPKGEMPEEGEDFEISADNDYTTITNNLKRRSVEERRSMEVEDLIAELFADRSYSISTVLADIVGSDMKADELRNEVVQTFKRAKAADIKELSELPELTNINLWVKKHPQKIIGADDDVDKVMMALAGRSIKNAMITGPAGTGKTSVVYELAQRINADKVPEFMKGKIIYEMNSTALVAGTRYRGDMEEKLLNILELVKQHPEVVLFIDECQTFLKLGSGQDDAGGAGDIIKPYITRGELQMIMCTTNEEYTKYVLPDKAFSRRFTQVLVQEPTEEDMHKILEGMLPVENEYFKKDLQLELLDSIIDLSKKYSLELANPAKAINMLELACAYSRVFEEKKQIVDVHDVIESVKLRYAIYISDDKMKDTKEALFKELLGQDKALTQVCRDLTVVDKGLYDPTKPMFSMLFAGPTGTGKTATAKIIAKHYFGSENNLIKINMGEYSTETDVTKLTGSSAGYVGYDDDPYLLKQVRTYPNSVVLFDECEKAHPSVWKTLLNILDEGEMKDNKGNRVSFRNCIIIFTTNLGCTKDTGKATGMGFVKTTKDNDSADIMKAIESYFKPEFLGRLDDIVMYNRLPRNIIDILIERYRKFYAENSGLDISLTKEDYDVIAKEAHIEIAGARGLMRAVRKRITENLIALDEAKENKSEEAVVEK